MNNNEICVNKSLGILVIIFLLIGTAAFILSQLPRSQITNYSRAETADIIGGVADGKGCYEYNNSSHCAQDCKKSHGNLFQCSGLTSLTCCLRKLNPTLSPLVSPIITDGFTNKIASFKLSDEQSDLLNNAGFTPINFVPSEISSQLINMSGSSNDLMIYDKNNEGGVSLSGFKGNISANVNLTMLGLLSVTPSDHYAYLVQMLYEKNKDEEYLIEFYEPSAMKFLNEFITSSYYQTNIFPYIKRTADASFMYFPIRTQFLSCQNKSIYFPRISESCLVFGYKEVINGYELEYYFLDLR